MNKIKSKIKNPWNGLNMFVSGVSSEILSSINLRRAFNNDGVLVYKNSRPKSIIVVAEKQRIMSYLEHRVNELIPKYIEKHKLKPQREHLQKYLYEKLMIIKDYQQNIKGGKFSPNDEKENVFTAKDRCGRLVNDALFLYYKDSQTHIVSEKIDREEKKTFKTAYVVHIEPSPQISINSSKNIVVTKVQGRDCSRKELVGGGDMEFTINGIINTPEYYRYPTAEVQKFLKIMQHNGIVGVECPRLRQLGITELIITNFSLPESKFINEQPYSISCIAIEPNEDIQLGQDTISTLNTEFVPIDNGDDAFFNFVLAHQDQFSQTIESNAMGIAGAGVETVEKLTGLDKLTEII